MGNRLDGSVANWKEPTKIWNSMFISVFIANIGLMMGQQMSNSLLSLYAKSLGSPADEIGLLMSMFAVTALVFRFIAGPAINAFNRKKLVAMGMGFMTIAYVGFSLAPKIAEPLGLPVVRVLMAFRLIQGIGNAFGSACLMTIVADTIPKDKFAAGMGYYALAQVVAQAIGPTVGTTLRDLVGYNTTYIINACVMSCAIIACSRIKLAPRNAQPFKLTLNNIFAKEAFVPAGITFLVALGFTSINAFMLVYAEERGISHASLFFTVSAVTMLFTRPTVGKLTDKYGFVKIAVPSICVTALSLVLIGLSSSLPMLLVVGFINAFGYGAVQPALQSLCMKSVVPERRGSAASTNQICMDLATIIGPYICGVVADTAGYTPLMWAIVAIPVLCSAAFAFIFRRNVAAIEEDFLARNSEGSK